VDYATLDIKIRRDIMNVLIVGGGGREHAIAYGLDKSKKVNQIYAMPGNPGIATLATCLEGSVVDFDRIEKIIKEYCIDFTVIGPEDPLCLGLASYLEDKGHKVFGPRKEAARLEGSKSFSKDFMLRHHIPTANYQKATSYQEAISKLESFNYPVVIKADGLAAGKGVVIVDNEMDAKTTLKQIMEDKAFGAAGNTVVLEEFLNGFECSLLCFVDQNSYQKMVSVKDHKQIFDGNIGPNTGGMGSVSPNPFLPKELEERFDEIVLKPFMEGLKKDQIDFRGVIFIGLMIDKEDIRVLEFNTRFGDPEVQSIMLRLDCDLFEILYACSSNSLQDIQIHWNDQVAVTLVLASAGYPNNYPKGFVITGFDDVDDDIVVYHAGTSVNGNHQVVTSGGRVLGISAVASSLEEARNKVYKAAEVIDFEGKYYRKDIGLI